METAHFIAGSLDCIPLPSAQLHYGRDPHKNNNPWGLGWFLFWNLLKSHKKKSVVVVCYVFSPSKILLLDEGKTKTKKCTIFKSFRCTMAHQPSQKIGIFLFPKRKLRVPKYTFISKMQLSRHKSNFIFIKIIFVSQTNI